MFVEITRNITTDNNIGQQITIKNTIPFKRSLP